jgi:hypothetical protein
MPRETVAEPAAQAGDVPIIVPFRKADRESAFKKLLAFATRPEFRSEFRTAEDRFAGPHNGSVVHDDPTASSGFITWYVFDYNLRGRTLCERLLEARSGALTPAERRYLQRMRDTHMGLYEILEVRPQQGLTLADQVSGEKIDVAENLLTSQVFAFDVLAARVVLGPSAAFELDGAVYLFKQHDLPPLRDALQGSRDAGSLKDVAAVAINQYYIDNYLLRPFPTVLTAEGHETMPSRVVFAIDGAAREKLAAHPRFEEVHDGSFDWFESARSSRILGTVNIEGSQLVLETMSRERAEKGRRLLAKLLAGNATFERIESEALASAMKRFREQPRAVDDDPIPADIRAQILDQFNDKHYRGWIDESIPALDGQTPRNAARDPRMRSRVVALIKEIESGLARQRKTGDTTYSVIWMFAELGLEPL